MIVEQSSEICHAVSDIDVISLFDELKYVVFSRHCTTSPLEVLRYIRATCLRECFPNVPTI